MATKANVKTDSKLQNPSTAFVSQIRELPYTVDPELGFLRTDGSASWPFEFKIQMVVNNRSRWELPDPQLTSDVLSGLVAQNRTAEFRELREFAVLQRLFRSMFAGNLGPDFHLEELTTLARTLRSVSGKSVPTPRWELVRSQPAAAESEFKKVLDVLAQVAQTGAIKDPGEAEEYKRAASELKECSVLIGSTSRPDLIADSNWNKACSSLESVPAAASLLSAVQRIRYLRAQIGALNVVGQSNCAPPFAY